MKKSLLIMLSLCLSGVVGATDRPNVLFVAIDDLNDWVGCVGGHPQVQTPNLDKFNARGGMVMYDAHCPSTVCGPSRSSLLTGKYPHKTGVYGNANNLRNAPKAKNLLTLPQYFSAHGYHTLSKGKIFHKHPLPTDKGRDKGDQGQWAFDEWHPAKGGIGPIGKERPLNRLPAEPGDRSNHAKAFDWAPTIGNDETKMKDYITAEWAAEQLKTREFDKPFFMAIGFSKPHLPWYVPQKYFDRYPLDRIELPKTIPDDLEDILNKSGQPAQPHTTWRRVEKAGRHKEAVQAYLATITFLDDCVGVLLDGLAGSKYADNTIVVFWGDHGWHLGEKQKYGKTQLWQESCRVPLMVKVPGVTPGNKRCDGVVNLIDMYPTLVDLCGLPVNPENDGRSFAELLANPDMEWNTPTLSDYGFGGHRVYDGRYSYIVFSRQGTEELYDHKKDSMEWNNLVDSPEHAAIKKRLKALIPTTREKESRRNGKGWRERAVSIITSQ
jgi:arylsulfatase A-like enzyme